MRNAEPRGFKIDLQIRRRRDDLDSPANHKARPQLPTTKSTNHSRKLTVTVHNKHEHKNSQMTIPQGENKKIVISEFKVTEPEPATASLPISLNISNALPLARTQNTSLACLAVPSPQPFQQPHLASHQTETIAKQQLISQIVKKETQIQFYQNLLEEKTTKSMREVQSRQKEYEDYIESLISIYQAQLEKNKQLSKDLEDKEFEKKRQIINLEGRMGLNFSPRQLSTFSGMSAGSMLLDSFRKQEGAALSKKRSELFSFGSSNKLDKSRSMSKEIYMGNFLQAGRTLIQKGRRIIFE